jgi:hypothetical protein
MLYVMLLDYRPGLSREQYEAAMKLRAQWQYPAGAKVLGEYWLSNQSPAVVAIFEADSYAPIMEVGLIWGEFFTITTFPAVMPEEGMKLQAQFMQRRAA